MTSHRLERLFVYYPLRQLDGNPGVLGLTYQEISLVTEDELRMLPIFFRTSRGDPPTEDELRNLIECLRK